MRSQHCVRRDTNTDSLIATTANLSNTFTHSCNLYGFDNLLRDEDPFGMDVMLRGFGLRVAGSAGTEHLTFNIQRCTNGRTDMYSEVCMEYIYP